MSKLPRLRDAVNVPDFLEREKFVARIAEIRRGIQLDLNTYEHWNRTHPDQEPLDTSFERAMLDYLDGKGPMPELSTPRSPIQDADQEEKR